jgi:hypothetical protein
MRIGRRSGAWIGTASLALALTGARADASDHLDTRTVVENPAADIGDLYAWMAPAGRHKDRGLVGWERS